MLVSSSTSGMSISNNTVSYHVSPFLNVRMTHTSLPYTTVSQLESSDTTDTRDTFGTTSTESPVSTSSSVSNALTESTSHSASTTEGRSTTSATTTQSELGSFR